MNLLFKDDVLFSCEKWKSREERKRRKKLNEVDKSFPKKSHTGEEMRDSTKKKGNNTIRIIFSPYLY